MVGASCTLSFKHSTSDYLDAVNPFYLLENIYMRKMTRMGTVMNLWLPLPKYWPSCTDRIDCNEATIIQTQTFLRMSVCLDLGTSSLSLQNWCVHSACSELLLESSVSVNALQKRVTYSQALPTSDELRLQTRSTFLTAHSHCTTNSNTFQSLQKKHKTRAWDIQSLIS